LNSVFGYILIDGKFSKWKTRFLTLFSREGYKRWSIILSNFFNKYEHIRWNSVQDLIKLLTDVWLLWESQNYTLEQIKMMYETEGKDRLKEKMTKIINLRKKYPNIPCNGFYTNFLLLWDEMQNIFYNREAMQNFTWDKKGLLKLLHQVRHFNTKAVFALTSANEIDLKFRKISSFYISLSDFLGWLFIKYKVYYFDLDRTNNFDIEIAKEVSKVPIIKFNGYKANKIINRFEKIIRHRIKFRFNELWFFSKFNADPDTNIYTSGDLFRFLDHYYENGKNNKFLNVE
jgi:hypothetical protein